MSDDSSDNRREVFRVVVAGAGHQIEIDHMPDCGLLDASSEGLATLLVSNPNFKVGEVVQVALRQRGGTIAGLAEVRNIAEVSPGQFRCGLQFTADAAEVKNALHKLAMDTQRAQLRRDAQRR